jgi:hypothetical protein
MQAPFAKWRLGDGKKCKAELRPSGKTHHEPVLEHLGNAMGQHCGAFALRSKPPDEMLRL